MEYFHQFLFEGFPKLWSVNLPWIQSGIMYLANSWVHEKKRKVSLLWEKKKCVYYEMWEKGIFKLMFCFLRLYYLLPKLCSQMEQKKVHWNIGFPFIYYTFILICSLQKNWIQLVLGTQHWVWSWKCSKNLNKSRSWNLNDFFLLLWIEQPWPRIPFQL